MTLKNTNPAQAIALFWFRRDLRLADNAGLSAALQSGVPVLPFFIFDTHILNKLQEKKDKRICFIYHVLLSIHEKLKLKGSTLAVLSGDPLSQIRWLTENYQVRAVYCNNDYEPYSIKRDREVASWLQTRNIPFLSFKDQVIFEESEIVKEDGTPYTVFTPYSVKWKQKLHNRELIPFPVEQYSGNFLHCPPLPIPSITEIGFEMTSFPEIIPEIDEEIIRNYHSTRDLPGIRGTSRLSVHLRFGTVSIRKVTEKALKMNHIWLNELIWREFFMMILYHFPHIVNQSFKKKYDFIRWRNNEEEFRRWCTGETGYPIVDAGMRELNTTGFMHNRVRMITAGFLTKHLLIDWRWGEAYFAEKLIDYELSSNNGNWQWAAGSGCDAVPYFRIFNPSQQVKKFDPEMRYIRTWVPELGTTAYPAPVVDHTIARQRALDTYRKALDVIS
jgi:deoxyribodipyrimidine photo-lyase